MEDLRPAERHHVETIKTWFDCVRDWFGLMLGDEEYGDLVSAEAPPWVGKCAIRLRDTLWAPVQKALPEPLEFSAYQSGYVFGLMRWGEQKLVIPAPAEVKEAVK